MLYQFSRTVFQIRQLYIHNALQTQRNSDCQLYQWLRRPIPASFAECCVLHQVRPQQSWLVIYILRVSVCLT